MSREAERFKKRTGSHLNRGSGDGGLIGSNLVLRSASLVFRLLHLVILHLGDPDFSGLLLGKGAAGGARAYDKVRTDIRAYLLVTVSCFCKVEFKPTIDSLT
ncbi:hypothetical protein PoB_007142100 [Plakobranchus ocellatus]|uniref:Uncharacterized protein n=1 Tax=Plakobranchus ocellatus TaxID=259542 RepID=A0AAV4DL60_9GAST|nr:hypothetical protein PoB_007142100 [Plakobranchus ocellatus]